jgi:broad specificity phosphatase PhoE
MLKIYLAQHGQDADSAAGVLSGRRDEPLTDIGIESAQELTRTIWSHGLHFSGVYCSPLKRAQKTAELLTDTLELPKAIVRPSLTDRDLGTLTGLHDYEAVDVGGSEVLTSRTKTYYLHPKGGETFPELFVRARDSLAIVKSDHQDGNVLIVSHDDVCKLLFAAYYELEWQPVLSMFHFEPTELLELSPEGTPATALLHRQ